MSEFTNLDDLRGEMEELRALVNTLLTVIMEEADGVHSGSAQPQTPLPNPDTQCSVVKRNKLYYWK